MPRIILSSLIIALAIAGFSLPPARGAETPSPPSISVEAEGKVMATPDLARLILEVETQAATAAAAAQDNAQRADRVLIIAQADAVSPDPVALPHARAATQRLQRLLPDALRAIGAVDGGISSVGQTLVVAAYLCAGGHSPVRRSGLP